MTRPVWIRRGGLLAAGALASTAPVLLADQTSDDVTGTPLRALGAAAAWHDVLDAYRAPQLPPPGETESAIVVLKGAAVAQSAPEDRAARAAEIALQQATVEPSLLGVGATINFRYRALVNGFGIRVPTGRLALVAELPEVEAIYPVTYMAPAQSSAPDPQAQPLPGSTPAAPAAAGVTDGPDPATIAVIDAGIQPDHPWLGGGMGPDRLILGGADFVNGNAHPRASADGRFAEAHGTEIAGVVLRSPALAGLPPERIPRMLVYRVVAREFVDGRVRPLARTDRVLAAFERAVDPNGDGGLDDRAEVVLLGVAQGFDGGGGDPIAAAARAADGAGSLVVAPAGNDGPSFGSVGTVGGAAASEHVLTVGGMGAAVTPRVAALELQVGPAAPRLTGLPLIGPTPPSAAAPIVMLAGPDGVARGDEPRDYADARGQSRVAGAIAVVGRGGGTLAQKTRTAASAGAVALAVWDHDGPGLFPGINGGADYPIPVIGLGARQGGVLIENPGLSGRIVENAAAARGPSVATFSSRGPTAEGNLEPDLVAPAVDIETAYPGPGGEPLVARMTGTSAAAAQVAAMALRVRVDRPELDPSDVRSLLVQAAEPVPGVVSVDQGAGAARMPGAFPIAVEPAVVSGVRSRTAPTPLRVTLRNLSGADIRVRLAVDTADGVVVPPGDAIAIAAGAAADTAVAVPPGEIVLTGRLLVLGEDGRALGYAPLLASPAPVIPPTALGTPEIRVRGDVAEARVAIGRAGRNGSALLVAPLHGLGIWLVPQGGGEAIRMAGAKQTGNWPVGTYRFVVTRRQVDGREIARGSYRLRVVGLAADGRTLVRESEVFRLR